MTSPELWHNLCHKQQFVRQGQNRNSTPQYNIPQYHFVQCPRPKTGMKCSPVQCQSHADISRYLRAFPAPLDTHAFSAGYCSESSKHHQAQMPWRFSFSLDLMYVFINLSLVQSAVVNTQTSLLWVTLKSHITSSRGHGNKLNRKPFQVFENHFSIAEVSKFQKDPRTEILVYKILKGHCKLRACFLSWGNIHFLGSWAFLLWQCVFLRFSFCILLKKIKSVGMLMWAAIKVAWLEGETAEQKTCLMENMGRGILPSLGTRQILEKHGRPLWHVDRVPRSWNTFNNWPKKSDLTGILLS